MPRPLAIALLALAGALAPPEARAARPEALEAGREWRIAGLAFRGNRAVPTGDLRDAMEIKARPWYAFWLFWAPLPELDPITLRDDIERLRQLYRNRGHYEARVEYDIEMPEEGNAVRVVVSIDEEAPVFVESVSVTLDGVPLEPAERQPFLDNLPLARDQVFDQAVYERAFAYLRAYYREHGFARVEVTRRAEVDLRRSAAAVFYRVESGPPCVFGEVTVGGTRTVDPEVVRREVAFAPGEPFRQSLVDRTRANLVALRLFTAVRIDEDEGEDERVDLHIGVTEGPTREVRLGVGYDTEEEIRGIAAWRDYDFLGGARQLGFTGRASFLRRTLAADFLQPHFPRRRDRVRLILSSQQEEEDAYTNDRVRLTPRIELGGFPTVVPYAFYRIEYDSLSGVDPLVREFGRGLAPSNGLLSGLGVGVDWNMTDDLLDPTRGWVTSASVEPVGEILGGDFSFVRMLAEGRYYQPFPRRFTGAVSLRIGAADPIAGGEDIPLFERFYAGGINSVRGYERRRVGPTACLVVPRRFCSPGRRRFHDLAEPPAGAPAPERFVDDEPIGGRTLVEASVELSRPITERIGAAIFLDAGQVSLESYDFPFDDLRYGTGFGVRYRSPIGPLRLDLGFPVQRPLPGDARWQVHVSIGQAF